MDSQQRKELLKSLRMNKRQVKLAINHLNSFHVRAVKTDSKVNELSLDNVFAKQILPLWVSLFEIELDILLYQNPIFEPLRNDSQFSRETEINRWLRVIDIAFRSAYNIKPSQQLNIKTLGDTNFHRYKKVLGTVKDSLSIYVEMRNRIAHGQWAIAFGSYNRSKNQELTQKAWTLSKKDMMTIKVYYKNLPPLIHNLCLSSSAFDHVYDRHMYRINIVESEIDERFKWLKARKLKNKASL